MDEYKLEFLQDQVMKVENKLERMNDQFLNSNAFSFKIQNRLDLKVDRLNFILN